MKKKVLTALLIIETVLLTVILIFGLFRFNTGKTEKRFTGRCRRTEAKMWLYMRSENLIGLLARLIIKYMGLQTSLSMFLMTEEEDNLLSSGKKLL